MALYQRVFPFSLSSSIAFFTPWGTWIPNLYLGVTGCTLALNALTNLLGASPAQKITNVENGFWLIKWCFLAYLSNGTGSWSARAYISTHDEDLLMSSQQHLTSVLPFLTLCATTFSIYHSSLSRLSHTSLILSHACRYVACLAVFLLRFFTVSSKGSLSFTWISLAPSFA